MEKFEYQADVADQIEKLWINYKKDSSDRKTKTYLEKKIILIKELYDKFVKQDEQSKSDIAKLEDNHPYLVLRENVADNYKRYITEFRGKLNANPPLTPTLPSKNQHPPLQTNTDQQTASASQQHKVPEEDETVNLQLVRIRRMYDEISSAEQMIEEHAPKATLEITYEDLRNLMEKITNLHDEICVKSIKNVTIAKSQYFIANNYAQLRQAYRNVTNKIQEALVVTKESKTSTTFHQEQTMHFGMRLPKLELPKFYGDYSKWSNFRDLYCQIVHDNIQIPNAVKISYLKTCVAGAAAKLISNLEITEDNYNIAWKLLHDRYENKRLLAHKQLATFLRLPKLSHESGESLKELHDTTKEILNALKGLGFETSTWDLFITHIILNKIDPETSKLYEMQLEDPRKVEELKDLLRFLEQRFLSLETHKKLTSNTKPSEARAIQHKNIKNLYINKNDTVRSKCRHCDGNHKLSQCAEFKSLSVAERTQLIQLLTLCRICFEKHNTTICKSGEKCNICNGKHNTLMHNVNNPTKLNMLSHNSNNGEIFQTLLGTALITAHGDKQKSITLRALIDSGSQGTFITKGAANLLNVRKKKVNITISGMGGLQAGVCKNTIEFDIVPRFESKFSVRMEAMVFDQLTHCLPEAKFNTNKFGHLQNIRLADPQFNEPSQIDIIIGADYYPAIVMNNVLKGNEREPMAQETELGWIVIGCMGSANQATKTSFISTKSISEQLQLLIENEGIADHTIQTEEEIKTEENFTKTVRRDFKGRYIVNLPLKENVRTLGESRKTAIARLIQLERRFSKDLHFKERYVEFMREYLKLKHMAPVKQSTLERKHESGKIYYIPHHGVINENSSTTKLRVVFDASARTTNGVSLNDIMLNGPKIQEDLDKLILRWREHKYVIAADIEKMFRQIWIDQDQQNYQRIVWRENPNHPIQDFVLKTVTYGTKPASFLSIRTLNKLAEDEGEKYPVAAKILKEDFYVDDMLTGSDTKAEVINAFRELSGLMAKGGFLLRKWTSNDSAILAEIPKELRSNGTINIKLNDIIKTLGILYDPRDDKFQFNTQHLQLSTSKISTKRSLLSDSSKIFDPMGWLSPIVISSKLLMQDVWISGIGWDDKLPTEIDKRWSKYKNELKSIDSIVIPRWVNTIKSKNVEIHGFADASEKALAAAVYYRVIGEKVETTLIMAKTKVAPITNKITIPRLELNASLLLVKLLNHIRQSTQYARAETYCWTDSTIALSWIKGNTNNYKPWVSNRVSVIKKLLPQAVWRHVPSEENPADVASRGINPGGLHNLELWWSGPTFLRSNKAKWPENIVSETKDELKQILFSNVVIRECPFLQLFSKISEYRKLIRIIAYTLRFTDKCKKLKIPKILEISAVEFKKANEIAIKMMQKDEFSEEITRLQTGQQLNKGSKLLSLNPFLDDKNILRVGGRIEKSIVPYDQKHPIILPKSGLLTILIIKDAHRLTLHGGTTLVIAFLRQRYWITNVRSAVRYIIHKCVTCCRYSKNNNHQLMAPLPRERVTASMPFEITGVDYAGPISIKTSKSRSKQTFKGYIAIFVCFTTKACHIEVVSDQTTEAFIAAYRRFSSRRGVCAHIYSDNGTTFVGANRKINGLFNKLLQAQLTEESAYQGTNWHFIPPGTPHFGGLWEAGVKSAKYHLKRVIGDTQLTFEELATLCSQIEACMNSRPLSIISSESETSFILTPAHFLIGRSLLAVPEDNYGEIKQNRLSRWELLQQLKQHFWKRWHTDYLNSLQQRYKWKQLKPNIVKDQIVLIKNKDGYPSTWPMGKVVEVHPGDDGNIRVISVKHKTGITKHSIRNLCPLPIEEDNYVHSTPPTQPNEESTDSDKNIISTRRVTRSMKAFHCGLSADTNNVIRITKNRTPAESKAKPMRLGALIKAILFVIILSRGRVTTATDKVHIQQFNQPIGLYLENIGEVDIIAMEWNLIIRYKMSNYWEEINQINMIYKELKEACKNTSGINCVLILNQLDWQLGVIQKNNEFLMSSNKERKRQKRGIGDTMGILLGDMFGILSQREADQYENHFETIDRNEQHLLDLISNQTSVIKYSPRTSSGAQDV